MFWGLFILMGVALLLLVSIGTVVLARVLTHPGRRTVGGAVARGLPTDPLEAGASRYETHRVSVEGGAEVEVWEALGEQAGGPVVIILHGWGDSRLGGLLWFEVLLPVASKLVLFDARGHGESKHKKCSLGVSEVGDAVAVARWVRSREAAARVVFFGYSMGAAVGIAAAVEAGGSVDAVIADSPYRFLDRAVRGMLRMNRLPTWPMVALALAWLAVRGLVSRERDVAAWAARLAVPLLVLHGEGDRVSPVEDARRIAEDAPRGELRTFKDCDHLEACGASRESYVAAVNEFLEKT